jgi:hypothetical protein
MAERADLDRGRPEPVLIGQLVTAATAIVGLLAAFGVPLTDAQQVAVTTAVSALTALVALGMALWARRKVTPVESPQDNDGTALIRADGRPLGTAWPRNWPREGDKT